MMVLWLLLGFSLLVWGAERFVDGAATLAEKWGVPSLIIGLTVVAFGTSAPELAVSVSASLAGANEIALGNVVGSNLFNLLVVAGLSGVVAPLVVERQLLRRDWTATIVATLALLGLMALDGVLSRVDGLLLLVGFGLVMGLQIRSAMGHQAAKQPTTPPRLSNRRMALSIVLGLGAIVGGGQLSVYGATGLARAFGLSETVIGLTIVAVGTSLPELVTSLVATKRGDVSIAMGNVIGSNLFNILFVLGISCAINPIVVAPTAIWDVTILLVVTAGMFVLATKNRLNRPWGIGLSLCYVGYTAWLLVR